MTQFALRTDQWTQIVPAGGALGIEIKPHAGSFAYSILVPGADAHVVPAPDPQAKGIRRWRVRAGIPVFAIAIDEGAIAAVTPEAQ